jgi:hypothetical protein
MQLYQAPSFVGAFLLAPHKRRKDNVRRIHDHDRAGPRTLGADAEAREEASEEKREGCKALLQPIGRTMATKTLKSMTKAEWYRLPAIVRYFHPWERARRALVIDVQTKRAIDPQPKAGRP